MSEYLITRRATRTGEITRTETARTEFVRGEYQVRDSAGETLGVYRDSDGRIEVYGEPGFGAPLEYLRTADDERAAAQMLADYTDGYYGEDRRTVTVQIFGSTSQWQLWEAINVLGFQNVAERNVWVRTSPDAHLAARRAGRVVLWKI
jgi:hypothetical protein